MIVNTVQHTGTDVRPDAIMDVFYYLLIIMNILQKAESSSNFKLKRRLDFLDSVDNNHHLKKQRCIDLRLQDDEVEIGDITTNLRLIKGCMREIAEHLQVVDYKLEEIIRSSNS